MYLVSISEQLSELGRDSNSDSDMILGGIEMTLNSLNEVFSKDLDPISDIEGYAVRRISQEIATLVKLLRCLRKDIR